MPMHMSMQSCSSILPNLRSALPELWNLVQSMLFSDSRQGDRTPPVVVVPPSWQPPLQLVGFFEPAPQARNSEPIFVLLLASMMALCCQDDLSVSTQFSRCSLQQVTVSPNGCEDNVTVFFEHIIHDLQDSCV